MNFVCGVLFIAGLSEEVTKSSNSD